MKIENRSGESLPEATVTVDDAEIIGLLEGLADVIEKRREHLHFKQAGGPELVVRHVSQGEADADPLGRHLDWWLGPAVLFGTLFAIVGAVTVVRWAIGLLGG